MPLILFGSSNTSFYYVFICRTGYGLRSLWFWIIPCILLVGDWNTIIWSCVQSRNWSLVGY